MSVLIPGMEMPTSCISCLLNFGEKRPEYGLTIYCPYSGGVISWRDKAFDNGRLASCGIVPVPEHGRLIDADALYEKFLRLEREAMSALQTTSIGSVDGIKWSAILTERTGYKFDIVDAPTIIPASEEKEK